MLTRLETARLQEFGNDGKPLVNGKLYFYALQTTTPKETYQDIFGTALNENPVLLDSVGSASIYLNGSYTVSAVDQYGVVVGPPVDIAGGLNDFTTSAGGNFANNIVLSVNAYSDIRALGVAYAWVFCQGRETQGDGGQGLFHYSVDNSVDDDGVTLSPNINGSYVRYNIQNIDPRWFGLAYGGIVSQEAFLTAAGKASERYGIPVKVDGEVYINSNYSTSLWASEWIFTSNASLVSTLGITFTFTSNNRFLECGAEVFKNFVQPIFEEFTTDIIKFSWMGGSNEEGKVAKLLASSVVSHTIEFDRRVITTESIIIPENFYLFIGSTSTSGNIYFDTVNSVNLTIPKLLPGSNQENVVKFKQDSTVGNITLGFSIDPIFFCSNTTNETTGIIASLKAGNITLSHSYVTSAVIIVNESVKIKGNNFSLSGDFSLDDVEIYDLSFSGKLTTNNSIINDSILSLSGSNLGLSYIKDSTFNSFELISGTFYLNNIISNSKFSQVNYCVNSRFENYISPTSVFSGMLTNSTFQNLFVTINSLTAVGLNISLSGSIFNVSGTNVIESSTFTSQDYVELCSGTSGEITFNSCVFSDKIYVSNAKGVIYRKNSCIGGIKETSCIVDGISLSNLALTSASIITNTSAGWVFTSAGTSSTRYDNITSDGTSIIFTSAGSYDYVTSSVGACVRIGTSADLVMQKFNAFGGEIEVTTENIGNSRFKVCVVPADFSYYATLNMYQDYIKLTNPQSISGINSKSLAETPYIVNNTKVSYNFVTGLLPTSFYQNTFIFNISDNLRIRQNQYINSASIPYNTDIVIVGFISSGCKISIKIKPNVPKSQDVYNKFYQTISANTNSYPTISDIEKSLGNSYVSSGVNNVSNLWITMPTYESIADKVSIKGTIPTVYNESRTDNFVYLWRNGWNIGYDSNAWVSGRFNPSSSAYNPMIIQDNVQITLSPIVSGNLTAKAPDYIKPLSATNILKY